jgi:hypothetical protein
MARQWNLPDEFVELIEGHTKLDTWLAEPETASAELAVAMSALLPTTGDPLWSECKAFEEAYEKICPAGPSIPELLDQIDQQFIEFGPVLKIPPPSKSLVDSHTEVAAPAS